MVAGTLETVRIIIAPDKFAGTLTAVAAAQAIATGWAEADPGVETRLLPLSDGGPGFVEVLHTALGGRIHEVTVSGPHGEPVSAHYLLHGSSDGRDNTAYIESAQACGLHLVPPEDRAPEYATSYGVGELIRHAVAAGARTVVVGLGGSATNDGGAGMLAALGATADSPLTQGAAPLAELGAEVNLDAARAAMVSVQLVAATDVDNPLLGRHGASAVFGPQKGADAATVVRMDQQLAAFAAETGAQGMLWEQAGAGAAGGLGYGLLVLGGVVESGIGRVLSAVDLAGQLRAADLVITGEGSFDTQSLRGKLPHGVAQMAQLHDVVCLVLSGQSTVDPDEAEKVGIMGIHTLVDQAGSAEAALAESDRHLRELAASVARQWASRGADRIEPQ